MKNIGLKSLGIATALAALVALGVGTGGAAGFPTLDKLKQGPTRFKVVMGGEAALDRETGLVWELAPDPSSKVWDHAVWDCYNKNVGGRYGWRVPAVEELATLIVKEGNLNNLPLGHPFQNVGGVPFFWSASHGAAIGGTAYVIQFNNGLDPITYQLMSSNNGTRSWCVRAGRGNDPFNSPYPG